MRLGKQRELWTLVRTCLTVLAVMLVLAMYFPATSQLIQEMLGVGLRTLGAWLLVLIVLAVVVAASLFASAEDNMPWICGECGLDNPARLSACAGCGALDADRSWFCEVCETTNPFDLGVCQECSMPRNMEPDKPDIPWIDPF